LPWSLGDRLSDLGTLAYLAVVVLVAGDGVVPVLPGESTIAVAGALAAAGELRLVPVVMCAIAGAVIGDSITYWVGRGGGGSIRRLAVRGAGRRHVERAETAFRRNSDASIVFGRWVPGLRFTVALTCGTVHIPFPRYIALVAIGGSAWALQNAMVGYLLGRAFAGEPVVAIVASLAAALLLSAVIGVTERRRRRRRAARG
jgi:membrane-associated protein